MKHLSIGFLLTVLTAGPSAASCSYLGNYYSVGSVICAAGGWLEECTVAGYWSAIGQCNKADGTTGGAAGDGRAETFSKDPNITQQGGEATKEVPKKSDD